MLIVAGLAGKTEALQLSGTLALRDVPVPPIGVMARPSSSRIVWMHADHAGT
jgi:hypothetical protein